MGDLEIRAAVTEDIPAIVGMLADDPWVPSASHRTT